jgi:hypothetical protein
MAGSKSGDEEVEKATRGPGPKSGTPYAYFDLNDSLEVARAVHDRGGGSCARDLVAVALGYSTTKSGAFVSRIYAAKAFGLITIAGDSIATTERAISILHPVMESDEIVGRRDAFLAVPLFQKVYEKYKGGPLPQESGLKNLLKTEYGIVEDRIKPALRVMLASAEQAGFFAAAGNKSRMIAPTGIVHTGVGKLDALPSKLEGEGQPERSKQQSTSSGGGGDGSGSVHPALIAMLRELPRSGSVWQKSKKELFMIAFRSIIDVVYPDQEVPP